MPNSATKRAQSRQAARVQRAHQTEVAQPVVRRAPAAKRKRNRPTGFAGFLSQYRWAISFVLLLTVGIGAWVVYANHLGPFAPKPFVAKCNLSTHTCDKADDDARSDQGLHRDDQDGEGRYRHPPGREELAEDRQ